ncbi:hypothetical protein F5Y15DRAFT_412371 [Xylariaceae sp. FL0016]|nr:hypothetical protein F5Y15DRAFT_412371 [Xylariaceae sp. FL0016]
MSNPTPRFWSGPLRYWRWAARERPALFWSCVIAGTGPVMAFTVPPVLARLGYSRAPTIPMTYPSMTPNPKLSHRYFPSGPRKQLSGYDD